jgi:hypothetical protein
MHTARKIGNEMPSAPVLDAVGRFPVVLQERKISSFNADKLPENFITKRGYEDQNRFFAVTFCPAG